MTEVHLFVYGSLLVGSGQRSVDAAFRRCCRLVDRAYIQARLFDLGRYPGARPSPDSRERVYGYLYALSDSNRCWEPLDRYEGFIPGRPELSEFLRYPTRVYCLSLRRTQEAWVYFYNGPLRYRPRIGGGDYLRYRQRRLPKSSL